MSLQTRLTALAQRIASQFKALPVKIPVKAASTVNLTLSGAQTLDGISCVAGDRVLVRAQTTESQNGIYVVAAGAWTRATDASANADFDAGQQVWVRSGLTQQGLHHLSATGPITLGTTSLSYVRDPFVTDTAYNTANILVNSHAGAAGAHAAANISYAGSTNLSSTTVEAALDELDSEKAPTTHGHALTDANITGTLPIAQVPTGTTGSTVALGNHGHSLADAAITGTLSVAKGGTGATDATTARTNLGVGADSAAGTASMRTLGTGATQAAAGNHTHTKANITDFAHTHVATTDLTATGTKNSTTFLRGDNTWAVPPDTNTTYAAQSQAEAENSADTTARLTTGQRLYQAISKWAVLLAGNQTVGGVKTFSSAPVVPDSSFTIAKTASLQAALDSKSPSTHTHEADTSVHNNVSFDLTAASTAGNANTGAVASRQMPTNWDWSWSYPFTANPYPTLVSDATTTWDGLGSSLKVSYGGNVNIHQDLWGSAFAAPAGALVTVSTRYRSSASNMVARVGIITANDPNPTPLASGFQVQQTPFSASTGTWTKITGSFIVPSGHTHARLQITVNNSGTAGGDVWVDGTSSSIVLVSPAQVIPGTIAMWPTASAPDGYLICDGSERPVVNYPALDALLGTTYGARTNGSGGAGTTHFRLPDFRGRSPLGVGTASPAVPGGTAHTLAQKGGEEKHTLTAAELPSHGHSLPMSASGAPSGTGDRPLRASGTADGGFRTGTGVVTSDSYGSSTTEQQSHNVLSPYLGINFIIKT